MNDDRLSQQLDEVARREPQLLARAVSIAIVSLVIGLAAVVLMAIARTPDDADTRRLKDEVRKLRAANHELQVNAERCGP